MRAVSAVHPANAVPPILFTPSKNVREVSPVQCKNAPALSNILGSVRDVIPLQVVNAYAPTLVNDLGSVVKARFLHPANAAWPMLVNDSENVREVNPVHIVNA